MSIQLTPKTRQRLQTTTYILLGLTVLAIIGTLIAWVLSEPGSFEPLNVLAFTILSLLTAFSAWLSRAQHVALPPDVAAADEETLALGPLRRQIADYFDLDEVRTLCLDLGIRYEDLSGDTITGKSISLVAAMQRRGQLPRLMAVLQGERPHVRWLMPAQLEQQYGLRRNVRAAWIAGVLHQSVTDEIALELKLTYQPQTLTRKVTYVPGQAARPVERSVPDLFAEFGSLLILGEPGSGKTMTMLQLAEHLLDIADTDPAQPTPVVVNLSSWAQQQTVLSEWLVEELLLQYQLPRQTGRSLITNSGLIYLLDGLDEVATEARDACVQAINNFKAQQPAPIVVCCRMAEYEALTEKLNLGMGIRIEPLSLAQVEDYLNRPELALAAVRHMVQTDEILLELAQTPLFLSVISLAYRGMAADELAQLATPGSRHNHLFAHYVTEMWWRRPLTGTEEYVQSQAITWLINLAYGMSKNNLTIFSLLRLSPLWLPTGLVHRQYSFIIRVIFFFTYGMSIGSLCWIGFGTYGLVIGWIIGGYLFMEIGLNRRFIENYEKLYEDMITPKPNEIGPLDRLRKLKRSLLLMVFGLFTILSMGFALGPLDTTELGPNGILTVDIYFLIFVALTFFILGLLHFPYAVLTQHYIVRWLLARHKFLPYSFQDRLLATYLDAMAERILLRRVGGGWVFIHRTLLDHFAAQHPMANEQKP